MFGTGALGNLYAAHPPERKLGLSILDVLCHGASPAATLVTDVQPFRLDVARRLGADLAVDVTREDPVARAMEATGGTGVDSVIECVGHYHVAEGQEPPPSPRR